MLLSQKMGGGFGYMCDAPHIVCYKCGSEFVLDIKDCSCGAKASQEYKYGGGWIVTAICPHCGYDNGEGE